jgi:hypothetical protein
MMPAISYEQAHGKGRPRWPAPHPAVVAKRVDDVYREVAAAVPAEGRTGYVGGCGHCVPCGVGAPQRCHRPDSPAGRAYDAGLARAAVAEAYQRALMQVELGLLGLPT